MLRLRPNSKGPIELNFTTTQALLAASPVTLFTSFPKEPGDLDITYYLQMDVVGLIKIGKTGNMKKRSSGYVTGNPYDVRLVAYERGSKHEDKRHQQFRHLLVKNEWFYPGPDLLLHITKLRRKHKLYDTK